MGYPSDLTDEQWGRIAAFFPAQTGPGRRRTVDLRRVVDALLYRLRTGCPWRWLPGDLPDWRMRQEWERKRAVARDGLRSDRLRQDSESEGTGSQRVVYPTPFIEVD